MNKKISIIIPAYNEAACFPELIRRLDTCISSELSVYDVDVWIVDDHSTDEGPQILEGAVRDYDWLHSIRLLKNSGSHVAIYAGLAHSEGDMAFIMGADLQDPPEIISRFVAEMKNGTHIVLGERERRSDPIHKRIPSSIFNFFMSRFVLSTFPVKGGDVFLIDRVIIDAVLACKEKNVNIFVLILSLCEDVSTVSYERKERYAGVSKWNVKKLIKLAYDSVITVGYLPLRTIFWVGLLVFILSIVGIIYLLFVKFTGLVQVSGWTSVLVSILGFGGLQMVAIAILGEYIWRNFDQTRQRPLFLLDTPIVKRKDS